jgi:hypothetical protein
MFPIYLPVDNFMGSVLVGSKKHYTVQNKRRKNDSYDCFTKSDFMYVPCPGEKTTTQVYNAKLIKNHTCKK